MSNLPLDGGNTKAGRDHCHRTSVLSLEGPRHHARSASSLCNIGIRLMSAENCVLTLRTDQISDLG